MESVVFHGGQHGRGGGQAASRTSLSFAATAFTATALTTLISALGASGAAGFTAIVSNKPAGSVAGSEAKWLALNLNGTTYYVPVWT